MVILSAELQAEIMAGCGSEQDIFTHIGIRLRHVCKQLKSLLHHRQCVILPVC